MFLISAQGGTPQRLTAEEKDEIDATWSPDGGPGRFRTTGPEAGFLNLSCRPQDPSNFDDSPAPRTCSALAGLLTANTWLRFPQVPRNSSFSISRATNGRNGAMNPECRLFPTWSRDGVYLYYDLSFTDHPDFGRVKVGQARREVLVGLKGLSLYGADFIGAWTGLVKDGSALFVPRFKHSGTLRA